ncbi:sigma-70 family RNA polymerase sigma factor [Kribbella sp.]|uniref:sigma-70 family RNA polymerase sigma factor n=1 Tax=Kribbella sp. TaxID=1871183 RepID=UPI002D37A90B|nr:sigma-70 family RNA polymerase sigma factor [Kribbella sp.]HZX07600.1 sigma-70 family RNA polymerase sigma factor [Kribbella sp.]
MSTSSPVKASHAEQSARTEHLLRAAHHSRDPLREQLRAEAIVSGMPLARTIARRYRGRGVDTEDLEQIAVEHLIRAVRNYRPTADSDFRSYAVPTIRGGIRHHFRDNAWAIKLPRRLQEIQSRVNSVQTTLAITLGHWPDHAELAAALGVEVDEIVEAEQARGCFQPSSLDAERSMESGAPAPAREVPQPGDTYELVDQVHSLRPVVENLPERDRLILRRRFVDHRTQAEIGAEIGVSQMQVSRRLRNILDHLQLALTA